MNRFNLVAASSGLVTCLSAARVSLPALTLAIAVNSVVSAVQTPEERDDADVESQSIALPSPVQSEGRTLRPGRTGLLREGSFLVEARGTLSRDERLQWWVFTLDMDDADAPPELIILPNAVFSEMQQAFERLDDERVVFEVTGQALVYRGRNFLLPTHAPRLERYVTEPAPDRDDAAVDDDSPATSPTDDDPVARAERELERAVGALARSPQVAATPTAIEGPDAADQTALNDGMLIVQRRGSIVRDPGGAWLFVFDADANGLSDPPLIILPCQLLEKIEDRTAQRGLPLPVLMSGTIMTYRERHYLLPSIYRLPRDRNGITSTGRAAVSRDE